MGVMILGPKLSEEAYSQTDLPVIMVTAVDQSQCVVDALANGANDYVMKDRLARLAPAIKRALQETRIARAHKLANEALRDNEARLRKTVEELRWSEEALRKSNDELLLLTKRKRVQFSRILYIQLFQIAIKLFFIE